QSGTDRAARRADRYRASAFAGGGRQRCRTRGINKTISQQGGLLMTGSLRTHRMVLAALAGGLAACLSLPAVAQNFGPPELIEAAKKEGKLIYYTANFTEVEQETIKAFNKRFPFVKIELVRAPGGQLITRVRTEA